MHRQLPGGHAVGGGGVVAKLHEAIAEQRVDVLRRRAHLRQPRVTGDHHILRVVLVGGQPHRTGLHAQRNVLGHQHRVVALRPEVQGTGQDAVIVGVIAKTRRQHRRVRVIQLDLQGAAVFVGGHRQVQAFVPVAQILQLAQRRAGEPTQFGVVPLGLQLVDHHQRQHNGVLGEFPQRMRVGQQHRRVQHVGAQCGVPAPVVGGPVGGPG